MKRLRTVCIYPYGRTFSSLCFQVVNDFSTKIVRCKWKGKLISTKRSLRFAENPKYLEKPERELQKFQITADIAAGMAENQKKNLGKNYMSAW
jgi:hypothetical protein